MFLGVKTGGHDTAAALVSRDGEVVAAVAEERLNREKHSHRFPERAIASCLAEAGTTPGEVESIHVPYRYARAIWGAGVLPSLRYRDASLIGAAHHTRRLTRRKRNAAEAFERMGFATRPTSLDHHDCHAHSAFLTSPFEEAAVLSVDGRGERASVRVYAARSGTIRRLGTLASFPHSVGLLYSALTHHLGFHPNGEEGTVMALASYGDGRRFEPVFQRLLSYDRRRLRTDLSLFAHYRRPEWAMSAEFERLTCPSRATHETLLQVHADLAAALQLATQRVVVAMALDAARLAGSRNLCLTGGVALNSVTNGCLVRCGEFDDVHVQSAPGDDGAALGAALLGWVRANGGRQPQRPRSAFLAPRRPEHGGSGGKLYSLRSAPDHRAGDALWDAVGRLADGAIVGLFCGRGEFGPRALGHRSILADPSRLDVADRLNRTVKYREPFRPFAIALLSEQCPDLLGFAAESPHMSMVFPVPPRERRRLAGVVHVDETVRIQTVSPDGPSTLRRLLELFYELTGVPALVNTSLNIKGQPIIESPGEALDCMNRTGIDFMLIEEQLFPKHATAATGPTRRGSGSGLAPVPALAPHL